MLESLLCGASAGRAIGVKLNNDQELFAQGVGNLVLPLFDGIPATAALARTSVSVIGYVPLAALVGVLMVSA